ncbi:hypothetical protein FRC01_003982 [Tulasnella sp. 417]|nr:hypothetical protein FRC01_003982 [Tulasnella sp. 417]
MDGVSRTSKGEAQYDMARIASVRPLTETCRAFYRICQPLLFETIVTWHLDVGGAECLANVLESKPHLRNMVSKLHITWGSFMTSKVWNRMEKALMELCSIRELWIWNVKISRALMDHFQQCPRLERLVLFHVEIADAGQTIFSFRSLKYLRCKQVLANFFTTLSLPSLEILRIGEEFIDEEFQSGSAEPEDHHVFQFNPAALKELIIDTSFVLTQSAEAGLLELLERANQITSLKLPQDEFSDDFDIPDELIPDLEIFDGTGDMVPIFCKGRPVRDLRVSFPHPCIWVRTDDVPSLLPPGSVPLEHLSISWCVWEDDTMEYIARHCPRLVSLKIRAERVDGTLSTCHAMPQLRSATFLSMEGPWYEDDDDGRKTESEARIVRECKEFWIGLTYLRLDPDYFWRYRGLEVERFEGQEVENP